MGYNERNPIFSFRLGEYRHGKLLRLSKLNKMPANDFLRSILDQYLAGDLIPKAKDDLAVEMTKLKLLKIKAEIEYLQLKNKYMENFGGAHVSKRHKDPKAAINCRATNNADHYVALWRQK